MICWNVSRCRYTRSNYLIVGLKLNIGIVFRKKILYYYMKPSLVHSITRIIYIYIYTHTAIASISIWCTMSLDVVRGRYKFVFYMRKKNGRDVWFARNSMKKISQIIWCVYHIRGINILLLYILCISVTRGFRIWGGGEICLHVALSQQL